MTYEVVLTGGKTVLVNEEQKKKLESYMIDKEAGNVTCLLGSSTIKISMVKGIFQVKDQDYKPFNAQLKTQHDMWDNYCSKMASLDKNDKIDNEITMRILPMFVKGTMSEEYMAVLRQTIDMFFTSHPQYPRCPSKVWWPIVKDVVDKPAPLFMEYVIRNDSAVEDYVKYKRI